MNYKDIKIVFFGTPDFAVESLDALIKEGCDIAAVVTAPDKPAGRGHKLLESAVKKYAGQACPFRVLKNGDIPKFFHRYSLLPW